MSNINQVSGNDIVETSGYSFVNIAAAGTNVIKSGSGVLVRLIVNKPVLSSAVTIYDNTAASGTKIGTVQNQTVLLQQQVVLPYEVKFNNGLTIVTSATDDITVVYK